MSKIPSHPKFHQGYSPILNPSNKYFELATTSALPGSFPQQDLIDTLLPPVSPRHLHPSVDLTVRSVTSDLPYHQYTQRRGWEISRMGKDINGSS